MNKKELAKFLYDNFYDERSNVINLSYLDFSEYGCTVDISNMIVAKNLCQGWQRAEEINQSNCKADYLWQCWCDAKILRMDNLKYYVKTDGDGDIVIYERMKKMTKKDIEKILGFEIEIIEGEGK